MQAKLNEFIRNVIANHPGDPELANWIAWELLQNFRVTFISENKSFKNLGRKFGDLTIIGKVNGRNGLYYLVEASCGHTKEVAYSNLVSGAITRCNVCKHEAEIEVAEEKRIVFPTEESLARINAIQDQAGRPHVDKYGKELA